jgi:formylglycine-generating enzyme required for sulfatase activity
MFEISLADFQRRLKEDPEDPELWVGLARQATRTDRVPGFLTSGRDAPCLRRLLERHPDQRELAHLWARLVGVELVRAPPGSAWRRRQRLGQAEDHDYDRHTGMPLRIRVPELDMVFAWIPPGEFWMGSPDDDPRGLPHERPRHTVAIPEGLYMATTPVTRDQFVRVLDAHPWTRAAGDGPRPATGVRWAHATEFCLAGHEQAGAQRAGYQLRLPSEAEWEYAARAGRDVVEAAEDVPREAWHVGNAPDGVRPVGERAPNPWGLYDVTGNVWEWCLDRFHEGYAGAPGDGAPRLDAPTDEVDEVEGDPGRRALRGGSVEQAIEELSVTMRKGRQAGLHTPHATYGMRPVLTRRWIDEVAPPGGGAPLTSARALQDLRELAEIPADEPLDEETVATFERAVGHFRMRQDPRCVVPLLEVFRGPPDPGAEPASLLDPGDVTPRSEDHVYELIPEQVWGAMLYGGILPALEAQPRSEVLRGLRLVLQGSDPAQRIRAMDLPLTDPSLADLYRRSLRSEHRDERYLAAERLRMVMGPDDLAAVREAYEDEPSEAVRAVLEEILEEHLSGED